MIDPNCSICRSEANVLGICEAHEQEACNRAARNDTSVEKELGKMYWDAVDKHNEEDILAKAKIIQDRRINE